MGANDFPQPSPVLSAAGGSSPDSGPLDSSAQQAMMSRDVISDWGPGDRSRGRTLSSREGSGSGAPALRRENSYDGATDRRRASGPARQHSRASDTNFTLGRSAMGTGGPLRGEEGRAHSKAASGPAAQHAGRYRGDETAPAPQGYDTDTRWSGFQFRPSSHRPEGDAEAWEKQPAHGPDGYSAREPSPPTSQADQIATRAGSHARDASSSTGSFDHGSDLGSAESRSASSSALAATGTASASGGLLSPSTTGAAASGRPQSPARTEYKLITSEEDAARREAFLRPWRVAPGLFVGNKRQAADLAVLARFGITHVLCMAGGMGMPSAASVASTHDSSRGGGEDDEELGDGGLGRGASQAAALGVSRHHAPLSDSGHSSLLCLGACMSVLGESLWGHLVGGLVDGSRDEDRARWRDPAVGRGGPESCSHADWAEAVKRRAEVLGGSGSGSGGGSSGRGSGRGSASGVLGTAGTRPPVGWPESLVLLSPAMRGCVLFLAAALGELEGVGAGSPAVQECVRGAQREAGLDARVLADPGRRAASDATSWSQAGSDRSPARDRSFSDREISLASAASHSSRGGAGGRQALVHCRLGVSRSPSAIVAYLVARRGLRLAEAWALVRAARPEANPHPCYARQLEVLDCCVHGSPLPSMALREALLRETEGGGGGGRSGADGSHGRVTSGPGQGSRRRRRFADDVQNPYGGADAGGMGEPDSGPSSMLDEFEQGSTGRGSQYAGYGYGVTSEFGDGDAGRGGAQSTGGAVARPRGAASRWGSQRSWGSQRQRPGQGVGGRLAGERGSSSLGTRVSARHHGHGHGHAHGLGHRGRVSAPDAVPEEGRAFSAGASPSGGMGSRGFGHGDAHERAASSHRSVSMEGDAVGGTEDRGHSSRSSSHLSDSGADGQGTDRPSDAYARSVQTRGRSSTAVSVSSDTAAGRTLMSCLMPPPGPGSPSGPGSVGMTSASTPGSGRRSEGGMGMGAGLGASVAGRGSFGAVSRMAGSDHGAARSGPRSGGSSARRAGASGPQLDELPEGRSLAHEFDRQVTSDGADVTRMVHEMRDEEERGNAGSGGLAMEIEVDWPENDGGAGGGYGDYGGGVRMDSDDM